MKLRNYYLLLLLLISSSVSLAQYTTTHYIAPSPWNYFNRYNELVVTTLSTTPVAVTIAGSDGTIYANSLTTVAGTPLRFRFADRDAIANPSKTILDGKGLKITASVPVGVQVRNIASDKYTINGSSPGDLDATVQKGNTAFTSLGDEGIGTAFRVGYYANVNVTGAAGENSAPLYSVLAIADNTIVSVNGTVLTTLNAGQSYLFQTALGSLVTATKSIVCNAGARADGSSGCADGVQSQVIPVNRLGNIYVVVRSNGNAGYERTTIVASQANTTVTVKVPSTNATTNYTLTNAGDFVTIANGDGTTPYSTSYITTNNPVAVYSGSADGCEIDMIVQPPVNGCSGSFDVQTDRFLNNINGNNAAFPYFGYVLVQSDTAKVYFNGSTSLESITANRTAIGTTGFYIIRYTNSQLGNPENIRFTSTARMNVALIESGAGYSMSAFISSISNALPPPAATATNASCLPTTLTAQAGFDSYQWYKDGVAVNGAVAQVYSAANIGNYTVTGTSASCGTTLQSPTVVVNARPNAGADVVACLNGNITLTGTSPASNGAWIAQSNNPSGATLSNTNNNIATATFTNATLGTYYFIFSVGCTDTMSVVVTSCVTPLSENGTVTTAGGTAINNIASNDIMNGSTAILGSGGNATISPSGVWPSGISLNTTTGAVIVATGTAPGNYPVVYQLCDKLSPTTCATVVDTIKVTPQVTPITEKGTVPATGGIAITNIRNNDVVNGVTATTNNSSISVVNTWPTGITLNTATGAITVLGGVTPGIYPITYQLCDTLTPNNCATVLDTVIVTAVVTPVSETGTVTKTGGTAIVNIAANDIVNGNQATLGTSGNATIAPVGVWPTGIALNTTTGEVTVAAGTDLGNYPIVYQLCDTLTPSTCNTVIDTIKVVSPIDSDGDGVPDTQEVLDGTNPFDGCSYNAAHQILPVSSDWKNGDCDGDGVTNGQELIDGTNPKDACSFNPASFSLPQSSAWKALDCDGDGVTNGQELIDGTNPTDGCSFVQAHKTLVASAAWNALDCDGDGVTNGQEIMDGTDAADPCSYVPTSRTLTPSAAWNALDCDGDGVTNSQEIIDNTNPLSACSFNQSHITLPVINICSQNCTLKADFAVNQLAQCVTSNQYVLTNTSTGGTAPFTYLWDLNDGNLAYTKDVTHTYAASGEHDVTLVVTDAKGCVSHANTKQIYIGAKPVASFNIITNTSNGNSYTFISTSTISGGWLNYYWDFGNGTSSTLVNPSVTFTPGTYTIKLIATGNFGCSDTVTKVIKVGADSNYCVLPNANFTVNPATQCLATNKVMFRSTNTDPNVIYDWAFGDGAAGTSNNSVAHSYLVTGTYTATLTVTNACGSSATSQQVTITDLPDQPLAINGTTAIMVGVTSQLTSATPSGTWSSANSSVGMINASGLLTGITAGTTTIQYTVSNSCGTAFTTVPVTIAVSNIGAPCTAPKADLTVNTATQCFTNNAFIFTNATTGNTPVYVWNFGDGSATESGNNATHNYTASGNFTVILTAVNACGVSTKTAIVTVKAVSTSTTTASMCAGSSYVFNGISYNAAGTYTVLLTNAVGCDSIATLILTTKAVTTSTTNMAVCASSLPITWNGITCSAIGTYIAHLTNSAGCDSVATLVLTAKTVTNSTTYAAICAGSFYWFNGNSYTTAGTYVTHLTNAAGCDSVATLIITEKIPTSSTTTVNICGASLPYTWNNTVFTSASSYVVHLTNAAGCDSAATLILSVGNAPEPPAAIVGLSNMQVGSAYTFASATPNGVFTSSNTAIATVDAATGVVTAIAPGITTITYTTSNNCGASSVSMVVTVIAVSSPCKFTASFTANNTNQCITDNQFLFTNTTSGGTAPFTYLWQLGDGATATTANVTKVYSSFGERDIQLKVKDANGCESDASALHIVVGAKPSASFTVLYNTGSGSSTTFISSSTIAAGNMSYLWDFGNGATSTLVNPSVTFTPGTYIVKLTVSGIGTCKSEAVQTINQIIASNLSIYPNPVGGSLNVAFKAASTTPTTVRIIDLTGRIIQTQTVMPSAAGASVTANFNTGGLMNGAYIITVTDIAYGTIATQQILKQ
jgi:PKD repeat protein